MTWPLQDMVPFFTYGRLPELRGARAKKQQSDKPTSKGKSWANTSNTTTLLDHHQHFSPVNHLSHRLTSTCNNVSLRSRSSQRRAVQARLPKVRSPSRSHPKQQMLTESLATTQRMALSSATSMLAVPLLRPCRPRLVPMAATRLSSTTCRK